MQIPEISVCLRRRNRHAAILGLYGIFAALIQAERAQSESGEGRMRRAIPEAFRRRFEAQHHRSACWASISYPDDVGTASEDQHLGDFIETGGGEPSRARRA